MFCPKCGANAGNANFCPKCGYNLGDVPVDLMHSNQLNQQPHPPAPRPVSVPPKKKKRRGCFIGIGVFLIAVIIIAVVSSTIASKYPYVPQPAETSPSGQSKTASTQKAKMIVDANKFSNISYQQLSKLMGGPGEKDKSGIKLYKASGDSIVGDIYYYNNDKYEFIVADNKVVRFDYTNADHIKFTDDSSLFQMFGLKKAGTDEIGNYVTALRYSDVSNKIQEFWVSGIDSDKNTFDEALITYDKNYFSVPAKLQLLESSTVQEDGLRYVEGKIKNNSSGAYSYVQVSINLYKSGNLIGSTFANVNNLEFGGTWSFKAPITEDEADSYKITDISGY